MRRIILSSILFSLLLLNISGQGNTIREEQLKSIDYSNPDLLSPPAANAPGYPGKVTDNELLSGFRNPPPGYGEVPFWWWSGDKLDKDRLIWQIEELHKKGITGMQVNYIHKDSPGWPTYPADPEIFSEEWWEMWRIASNEASKRHMGLGLSGYTIDWPKSDNLYNKIIYSIREIQGLELLVDTLIKVPVGNTIRINLPEDLIMVWSYDVDENGLVPGGKSIMSDIKDRTLTWSPAGKESEVWVYTAKRQPGTINPMHPLSGQTVIDKFFQPFENNAGPEGSAGLNYFFQDELKFGVGDIIWCDDFNDQFKKQKGYDVFTVLPSMFRDIGPVTPRARLDFMDVKVRLTEERYFKPIFEWHWKRGRIYGCDPEGRGKSPGEYGDNFRAIRWYTAPGHDTPSGYADLIKGKVSSSIAALYRRPRVWLEGYHSLGWGATPQQLMFATTENYLYGCNLLNLHGLYYTTHGSFWEWAPPCYHFRMPYWDHMPVFLKYFERLSWLMSHGNLQADIAILYPVSPAQARLGEKEATSASFTAGTELFNQGYDFLFIDDQSLTRAEITKGRLNVTDQSFRVLILPSMQAIRWSTIMGALEFFRNGGIVIACGSLPEASDRSGSSDPELDKVVKELFGVSYWEMKNGGKPILQKHNSGGVGIYSEDPSTLTEKIKTLLPKHVLSGGRVRYAHRKIGSREVFMVMGAKKDSLCAFRAKGAAERWDPWTGAVFPLNEVRINGNYTEIKMPLDSTEAQIIVFSTDRVVPDTHTADPAGLKRVMTDYKEILLDGDWEFELKPTMDNRWGDFRLPVTEKIIGAEARIFRYSEGAGRTKGWEKPGFDCSGWRKETYGFGQKFWKLGPLPENFNLSELDAELAGLKNITPEVPVVINGKEYFWTPYSFSWRYGYEGDPGHQGYHGLKEEITDEFICLGKPSAGLNETLYKQEKEGPIYYLWTSVFAENVTNVTIDAGGLSPSSLFIDGIKADVSSGRAHLQKGSNPILLKYNRPGRGHFVVLKEGARQPVSRTPLSMQWYDFQGRLEYDVRPDDGSPSGWYRFTAPPGLKGMTIRSNGKPKVWIDGKSVKIKNSDPETSLQVIKLSEAKKYRSEVAIRVEQTRGNYGGAAFPEPVLINCTTGVTQTGDWSEGSILENYSGGAWYRKNITLTDLEEDSEIFLDLGNVVATAEVRVNNSSAGIVVTNPWRIDISGFVKRGENKIEILVYNTLANHYLTIPTKYRGPGLQSGLLGPVRLEIRNKR